MPLLDLAQLRTEFGCAGRSVRALSGHCAFDRGGHVRGQARLAEIWYRLFGDAQELGDQLLAIASLEDRVTGAGAEQGRGQTVDIGGHVRDMTLQHLGRGEGG